MKFQDLVFLAEMDYSKIPGEHSQAVRDATLGDTPEQAPVYALKKTTSTDRRTRGKMVRYVDPSPEGDWMVEDAEVTFGGKKYLVYLNFDESDIKVSAGYSIGSEEPYPEFDMDDYAFDNMPIAAFEVNAEDNGVTEVTDPALLKKLKEEGLQYYFDHNFDEKAFLRNARDHAY